MLTINSFARQVAGGRWFMFFASVLIMAAGGGTYVFGEYSKAIRESLGYDQQTLSTLSFFKDVGSSVGILPGLINEVAPPWVVLACGAGMNLFGYLMVYLAVSGQMACPPVWLMCAYIAVGANSQSFANTGALVTAVKNFPENRGAVLGLLTGFGGISGAIFLQLCRPAGDDNQGASLLLLMACLPSAISLVFIRVIRIMPRPAAGPAASRLERKVLFYFLYASVVLAIYLLVMNVVELKVVGFPKLAYYTTATVLVFLILLPLVAIVVQQELKMYLQPPPTPVQLTITVDEKTAPEEPPRPVTITNTQSLASWLKNVFRPPARGENYSILQALFSVDMLVLSVSTICGIGGMLTVINNISQIGQSLGYQQRSISTLVSLVSIWNYAGRAVAGFASDHMVARYKLPRPLALAAVLLVACAGHLLIATGVRNGLYAASVIIGFCFGAQWPLLFAVVSEVFGLKYYSTLYNLAAVASPVGSYILNVLVAGRLYDQEALRQSGGRTCIGVRCFRVSFFIIAGVTLLGAAVTLVLAWRTRGLYKGNLYGRFNDETMAARPSSSSGSRKISFPPAEPATVLTGPGRLAWRLGRERGRRAEAGMTALAAGAVASSAASAASVAGSAASAALSAASAALSAASAPASSTASTAYAAASAASSAGAVASAAGTAPSKAASAATDAALSAASAPASSTASTAYAAASAASTAASSAGAVASAAGTAPSKAASVATDAAPSAATTRR